MDYVCTGIDVSAKKLQVATEGSEFEVDNSPEGHQKLIKQLRRRGREGRVCMESTGVYGLDLAMALYRAKGIEVMVLNPRVARNFAHVLMHRSKTDPVDARALRKYLQRMDFLPWRPPATEKLQLRALGRRISGLTQMRTQEKNRLHAANSTAELKIIRNDIEVSIRHLDRRIEQLQSQAAQSQAAKLIDRYSDLQMPIARIMSVKGIGQLSAILIYGELSVLPKDLAARQWVAHAGLDPRHFESGTFKGKTRISKAGNKYLRSALFMPAHNASKFEPQILAFSDHLVDNGKTKMQAKVAIMRKLLHSIHGMLTTAGA